MGGEVKLSFRNNVSKHTIKTDLDTPYDEIPEPEYGHDHVCSSFYTPYDSMLIGEFFDNYNFSPLDSGSNNWAQKKSSLDALREILGVTYDEAIYIAANIVNGAPSIFPFVKARSGNDWMDSSSMSFGELAVHRLRWEVGRPYERTVVLLDEPEANIAPRGHAPLLDELARLFQSIRRPGHNGDTFAIVHQPHPTGFCSDLRPPWPKRFHFYPQPPIRSS